VSTAADLVTSVRASTDQDVAGPLTDAVILIALNEEYPVVRREIALFAPDLFATESAVLTVASGATEIDVSAISSLDLIFEVKKLIGTKYRTIRRAPADPEGAPFLCWRRRGMTGAGTAVEIYPVAFAAGSYKLRYMATAPALAGSGAVLLPAGADRVLVEAAAARARSRSEEDYAFHRQQHDAELARFKAGLTPTGMVVTDVSGRY